jgi:hypothetical protein
LLKSYEDPAGGEDAASRANDAWSQLLRATQALAETSNAYIALPQDDPRTAEALRREESERIARGPADLRELAEPAAAPQAMLVDVRRDGTALAAEEPE